MLKKYSEIFFVILLGFLIFSALNCMMIVYAPSAWTDTHYGAWTAFHKEFNFSGFDQFTYICVTKFRPLYVHLRHPALLYFVWPLTKINEWLRDEYGMNCAIYVVAVTWTLIATLSWVILYKIFRRIVGLNVWESLLLNMFFYSFAYVMLAMFVPDHMILTMATLLVMLYLSGKDVCMGRKLATWKVLLLYFVGAGISTTNAIKIWLIDITARWRSFGWMSLLRHSMLYIIPTLLLAWVYYYQETITNAEEERFQQRIAAREIQKDSLAFEKKKERGRQDMVLKEKKQLMDNALFEWTDMTIPIVPTLVENIFGEGFILHKDYLMCDANIKGQRPVIVNYCDWYNYLVEFSLLLLFAIGVIVGRKEVFLWMCIMPFLFDMFIHVGLRFALADVYIMTAHWAFAIPVAVAFLIKKAKSVLRLTTLSVVVVLTVFLWWHNLALLVPYMLNR